ncbi:MAG: FliI/YscN family ATPase [Planctomycetaceae bacterium]|nr:FliI/YscN family ATPase [Planctomycetaceae bacterium]
MTRLAGDSAAFRTVGTLRSARGLLRASLPAAVGEACRLRLPSGAALTAEVVGFDDHESQLMCYDSTAGLRPGLEVMALGRRRSVPIGSALLGRVIDGIGRPVDGKGPLRTLQSRSEEARVPEALNRIRIEEPLTTGQRVIDGLISVGRGQRIGLFAGSGVGKSTLMGEIARGANADVNVIVLVGERGREVKPFIEDCLGDAGMQHSVVVVATSDQTPLMRIKAVLTGVTIAESFRDEGKDVLFFLDSITRLAMAQRELGLLLDEPPGSRGYPPSVQSLMASVLERLGAGSTGTITGLITVLVEGDDMDEPIADAARGILDGHIVLSRKLATSNHFPAVDALESISRVFRDVTDTSHQNNAGKVRRIMATYRDMEDLIQIGAYKTGTSAQVDRAIQLMPAVRVFLQQSVNEVSTWEETQQQLKALGEAWPY